MAVALLDSSAVVAYLIEGDTLHGAAVSAIESRLEAGTSLAISAVTWSELLHGARLGYLPEDVVRGFQHDFGVEVLPIDMRIAEQAADHQAAYASAGKRRERPRLRTPDALILATATVHADCETVICGDEKWQRVPDTRITIELLTEA